MPTIRIDPANKLVEVQLAGFFSPERADAAGQDVRNAVRSLGDDKGKHVTLYDVSKAEVVPGSTVALTQSAFANPAFQHLAARKVAFFTPSALLRMQVKRLREAREDIAIFEDRQAALDWLLA